MDINLFLSVLISLFVIVDPIGSSAVYASLTMEDAKEQARKTALKAVTIAIILLVLIALTGEALLHHLGISLPAFKIAGGLLLFVTGFRMIMGAHDRRKLNSSENTYQDQSDIAVFPLAIPLLAGPGTMTAVLLHMTEASSVIDQGMIFLAIFVIQLLALICMFGAAGVARVFGPTFNSIMARLIGVLMAAISVQFVADGLIEIMKPVGF